MKKHAIKLIMKRRIFVISIIMTLFAGKLQNKIKKSRFNLKKYIRENLHNYFYYINKKDKNKIVNRYYQVIKQNVKKYDSLSSELIAKVIKRESGFRWWVTNGRKKRTDKAVGCMQIIIGLWETQLHNVLNVKHRIEVLSYANPYVKYSQFAKQIKYNIDLGCYILDYYIRKHHNYSLGIMAYHRGDNSIKFKRAKKDFWILKNDDYVNAILG